MKIRNANACIEAEVVEVVSGYFSAGRRTIENGSRLVEDLYADSMSLIELVMALNEYFHIVVPADEVTSWKVVADICGSVRRCVGCAQ